MFRVGSGIDIHKLEENRKLVIGGVEIPFAKGFKAHSDGDVLVHALCDALLGAAGLKDIGSYYSDQDPLFENVNSFNVLLPDVLKKITCMDWKINNVDATIILEKPKLAPYIDEMIKNISDVLKLNGKDISLKAKTTECCIFQMEQEAGMAFVTVSLISVDRQKGEKNIFTHS